MRQPRRIPIILKALEDDENKRKVLEYWFKPPEGVQLELGGPYNSIDDIIKQWNAEYEIISAFWKENIDLRLPQVLISAGIMPNYTGFYFYKEDEATVILSKVLKREEILFWGNNYDAQGNLLSETRWVLPAEMTKGHLEAIIDLEKNGKMRVSEDYLEMFKQELKLREE